MNTKRRGNTIIQAVCCLIIAFGSISSFAAAPKQANVLFILIDDLRVQYGPYDIDQALTPNIDRLATQGVAFGRAYANVPICGASRASMLTSVRPTATRFVTFESASVQTPWATTLPQHFKEHGYYSISLGKVFNNPGDKKESWSEPEWRPNAKASEPGVVDNAVIMARHNYVTEEALEIARSDRYAHLAFEKADVEDDAYYNGQIANRAIADLKRLKEMDQPFFLAVGLKKPHLPFNAPARYWEMYDEGKIKLTATPEFPKDAPPQAQHDWGELRNYGHDGQMPKKGTKDLMPDDMARKLIHGYYAATSYSDALVGKLLTELEELELADDTIVVLWGDHGWSLGEHTQWAKHSSFNVTNQVPLIVKAPGMPVEVRGSVAPGLVESIDIYPSLAELAGLNTPVHVQGKSFKAMLDDPNQPGKAAVFPRWKNADSIRTDQYFYTEWRNQKGEVVGNMLFDHFNDPTETINLADNETYAPVVEKLHQQLSAHIQTLGSNEATETRKAAFEVNRRMGRGNNFQAMKAMKNQGALEDYTLLKSHFFEHCRIGYKMDEVAGDAPAFILPASNLKALQNLVDWCLSEGLIAVVDPVHNWTTTGFDNPADLPKLQNIWQQVAKHFADYDLEKVVFEIINEPREDDNVKDIIDTGLSAIRGVAGNEKRIVIVSGDGFSTRQALIDAFDNDEIPANDPYLIGTFHYYDPRNFTKSTNKKWVSQWGSPAEFAQVITDFDEVVAANKNWATRNSTQPLPLYLGEFGADTMIDTKTTDRKKWLSWVRMQAEARDMSWAHWTMYSRKPGGKGIGPWTSLEQNQPSARSFDADPVEALIGRYDIENGQVESIYIPKIDSYTVQIHYASDEPRIVQLESRNDSGSTVQKISEQLFPATGGRWQTLDIPVNFEAGEFASLFVAFSPDEGVKLGWIRVTKTTNL